MGRTAKPIDVATIKKLAQIGSTTEEVGFVLGVSKDTIERRFMKVMNEGRANLRMSIRRGQYKKALEGNPTMLIWLGKQLLGQKDHVENADPGRDAALKQAINLGNGVKVVF